VRKGKLPKCRGTAKPVLGEGKTSLRLSREHPWGAIRNIYQADKAAGVFEASQFFYLEEEKTHEE